MLLLSLELVVNQQHTVDAVGIELTRTLLEAVGIVGALLLLLGVETVLLHTAGTDLDVVQDVGQHQVEADASALLQAERLADRGVEHEAAVALALVGTVVGLHAVDEALGHLGLAARDGCEVHIYIVVVVADEVDIPEVLVVGQVDAEGVQRGAALAHAVDDTKLVDVGAAVGEQHAHVGIIGVLGFADGAQQLDVQPLSSPDVGSQLNTVVLLLDVRQRDVGKRALDVAVEEALLGDILQFGVVGVQAEAQQGVLPLVAELA